MSASTHQTATPLLSIRELFMCFEKRRTLSDTLAGRPRQVVSALNGVNLDVMPAETLGIVGESGCGKSTLARCIAGLNRPTSGDIRFEGESVIKYAHRIGATHIVRGLRQSSDFDDEFRYHGILGRLEPNMPMIHIICRETFLHVSSSTARELASLGEDVDWLVTPSVERALRAKFGERAQRGA